MNDRILDASTRPTSPDAQGTPHAVVLLGHGSRAPGASEAMERVVERMRERRAERIEPAYMELCEPGLETVLRGLHEDGIRRVLLVPYFLHHGVHLREDVPAILEGVRAFLPGLEVEVAAHLGFDDALVEVVERRIVQAIGG
jgi:sirohydrochlorin cobaltochelatase